MMLFFTLFATGMWAVALCGEYKLWTKLQKSKAENKLLLEHVRVLEGHIDHLNKNLDEM